jgi:Tol biopolymer transport system component
LDRNPHISPDGQYIAFRSERANGVGGSDIYLYDRETSQLVDLPKLNTEQDEYAPSVSENGSFIAFDRVDANESDDVFVYDLKQQQIVHTEKNGMAATILSGEFGLLAFQSARKHPEMGADSRDIFVKIWELDRPIKALGLNSDYEDAAPCFTSDAKFLVFHSKRPGGLGGSDIYAYHQEQGQKTSVSPNPLLQKETIPLTRTTVRGFCFSEKNRNLERIIYFTTFGGWTKP